MMRIVFLLFPSFTYGFVGLCPYKENATLYFMENQKKFTYILNELITNGFAYITSDDYGGSYICCDALAIGISHMHPQFIQYPCLVDKVRHKNDFPLWATSSYGVSSPWGCGSYTANLHYLLSHRELVGNKEKTK